MNGTPWSQQDIETLRRLSEQRKTPKQIAAALDRTAASVRHKLTQHCPLRAFGTPVEEDTQPTGIQADEYALKLLRLLHRLRQANDREQFNCVFEKLLAYTFSDYKPTPQ